MKDKKILSIYLAFSFIAAVLLILLINSTPSQPPYISFQEKVGIAGIFILCCGIGILFTFHPNWIRRYFIKQKDEEKKISHKIRRPFKGHHPDCPTFQNHKIHWDEKIWCAGCLGLFIGLCGAILLMLLYITIDFRFTKMISFLMLFIGLLILSMVYGEIFYRSRYAIVHVFTNSMLPLSFFIITISVGGITGKFVYGFFTILLCFLWLDTRIYLSKYHHSLLCSQCSESCKMFTDNV